MKIVDRKTFMTLPAGTIFCRGVQWAFDSICIKDDTLQNDWFYLNPAWPDANDCGEAVLMLEDSLATGASFKSESAVGRDGRFEPTDVYLIFEPDDLLQFRAHIDRALQVANA